MLHEMVFPREALVSNARAVRYRAGELGRPHAMHSGLVPLQIGQACEVGG